MKKIFYIVTSIMIITILSGFRGCYEGQGIYVQQIIAAMIMMLKIAGDNGNGQVYGIAVGENGSIYTSDGRPPAPWILRPSGTTQNLNAVSMRSSVSNFQMTGGTDSVTAFAVGNNSTVLRSTDYGYTWQNRNYQAENKNFYGVDVFVYSPGTEVHAVVCGDSGKVLRSTGSGSNWQWHGSNAGVRRLHSIVAVSPAYWVAVGNRGAVFKTLNAGANWENLTFIIGDTTTYHKIVAPRYDRLCIVGNNGRIYTSSNYGISWVLRNSGTTNHLRDVIFTSVDSGAAVGDNGTVRHTTDGGFTWIADSYFNSLTSRDIICITRVDAYTVNSITRSNTLVSFGGDSTFFLAVSSEPFIGIEPISNFIADIFSLKQNYPNPFNPVTNIEVSVPEKSFVKLIIYDVQGKEVEILVNRELNRGAYKIDWNAANYPSGVYFYKIITEGFTETKKMLLLK